MPPPGETRFIQNQLLMQLSAIALTEPVRLLLAQLGIRVITTDPLGALGGSLVTLELPPGISVRQAIRRLEADPRVPGLSTNYTFRLTQPPSTARAIRRSTCWASSSSTSPSAASGKASPSR